MSKTARVASAISTAVHTAYKNGRALSSAMYELREGYLPFRLFDASLITILSVFTDIEKTPAEESALEQLNQETMVAAVMNCDRACISLADELKEGVKQSKQDRKSLVGRLKNESYGRPRIETARSQVNDCKSTISLMLSIQKAQKAIHHVSTLDTGPAYKEAYVFSLTHEVRVHSKLLSVIRSRARKEQKKLWERMQELLVEDDNLSAEEKKDRRKLLHEMLYQQNTNSILQETCFEAFRKVQQQWQEIKRISATGPSKVAADAVNTKPKGQADQHISDAVGEYDQRFKDRIRQGA